MLFQAGIREVRKRDVMDSIYFPVYMDVLGIDVAVVGGANEAEELVERLLRAGARITLISPHATPRLQRYFEDQRLRWRAKDYELADLEDASLVFAAGTDPRVQHKVCQDARSLGLWVHRTDEPMDSTFHLPHVFQRGPIQVAIHADKSEPALTNRLVKAVAEAAGFEFGVLTEWLAEPRGDVALRIPAEEFRHELTDSVLKSDVLDLLREGKQADARRRFESLRKMTEESWALKE